MITIPAEPILAHLRCRVERVYVMGRTAIIAGLWFAFWMIVGGALGGFLAPKPDVRLTSIYYGIFNVAQRCAGPIG